MRSGGAGGYGSSALPSAVPIIPGPKEVQEGYELPLREVRLGAAIVRLFDVPGALRDEDKTLVCLPGMGASGRSFAPMRALGRKRRLLMWTPPLHTPPDLTPLEFNLQALEHPDAPLPERFSLLGSSYGSLIALAFALRNPRRVRTLILVSPIASTRRIRRPAAIAATFMRMPLPFAYVFAPVVARILGGKRLPPAARAEIIREARRLTPLELARRLRDILATDFLPQLGDLQPPTLVLHGRKDHIVPVRNAHEVAERIPGSKEVLLEGAAHLPYMSHPETFNAAVLEFLEERERW